MRTKHYNTTELAAVLGCSTSYVYQLLKERRIRGYKHRAGKWLVPIDQEETFEAIRKELSSLRERKEDLPTPQKSCIRYISDQDHFVEIFGRMGQVRKSLKIACANLKNFTVFLDSNETIPFCDFLLILLRRGVKVQLLCMHPFSFYRWVHENLPELLDEPGLEIRQNDHVHMKIFIYDDECAYIGSANLTGAAIGKRQKRQRNYEAGILVQGNDLYDSARNHFLRVWNAEETIASGTSDFKHKLND